MSYRRGLGFELSTTRPGVLTPSSVTAASNVSRAGTVGQRKVAALPVAVRSLALRVAKGGAGGTTGAMKAPAVLTREGKIVRGPTLAPAITQVIVGTRRFTKPGSTTATVAITPAQAAELRGMTAPQCLSSLERWLAVPADTKAGQEYGDCMNAHLAAQAYEQPPANDLTAPSVQQQPTFVDENGQPVTPPPGYDVSEGVQSMWQRRPPWLVPVGIGAAIILFLLRRRRPMASNRRRRRRR